MTNHILWAGAALWFMLVFAHHAWKNLRVFNATPGSTDLTVIPLVGGSAGAAACLLAPWPWAAKVWWLPLIVDVGALPYALIALATSFAGRGTPREALTPEQRAGAGSVLGTAVGDAMGLAAEGLSRSRQARLLPHLERFGFLFGKGMCSDDTEHACMTAQALLGASGDADRFARALAFKLRWWLAGLPAGVGFATARAILKLWVGIPPATSGVTSAGNGPAMRAPLIGACYGHDLARMRALIEASTHITHRDPRAVHGALAVALAAHLAARGDSEVTPATFRTTLAGLIGRDNTTFVAIDAALASVERNEQETTFAASIGCGDGVSGFMLHTVPVVIHVWLTHQNDFTGGIQAIIRLGGDTDSTAAILGGIIGARVGRAGIPARWLDDLLEWPRSVNYMDALGARAASTATENTIEPEIPLFVLGIVLRNLFFLVVVLAHGVRRLLPPY